MGQPAHDCAVLANHLHAINAKIEIVFAVLARTLGDDQGPGDQGRRLSGPAGLDRQFGQVDLIAGKDDFLNRGLFDDFGPHGHDGARQRQELQGIAKALGRHGLAQKRQDFTDLAQFPGCSARFPAKRHAHGHALDRAKQINQAGHVRGLTIGHGDILEQDGRPALGQEPRLDLGHFQHGRDRLGYAHQLACGFQLGNEIPQTAIGHAQIPITLR